MLMQQGFGADIQWLALQYSKMFRQSANILETIRPGCRHRTLHEPIQIQ